MRDRPGRRRPDAVRRDGADPPPAPAGNPFTAAIAGLATARRARAFWLLAGSFFICGASTNGLIGTHLIPAAMDHGLGEVPAASLLALIGVFDIVGTTCSGWLTDRYDPRMLLFWYYALRGLCLLALPYVFGSPHFGLILFVVFYGLDWVATVPPTVALTAEIFGRERVGVVFGWIFAAHSSAPRFAAWGAGAVRTWFGDYAWAFVSAGLLCLFACGLVARSPARRSSSRRSCRGLGVEAGVLEVDVALDALHHLLGDHPVVAQRDHGLPFGVEQLPPQALVPRRAFLDAVVVVSVVAGAEPIRAEAVLATKPFGGVLVHPVLDGELLEPGERRLGCLDPCLRILPLGAAVVLDAQDLERRGSDSTWPTSVPRMTTKVMKTIRSRPAGPSAAPARRRATRRRERRPTRARRAPARAGTDRARGCCGRGSAAGR